ncbi:hypothetical protein H6G54_21645 [Anabaena cylindrica FACHB-243]|uniref:Uncharacterized protein n=1 Tax=Anabaena cylindrica (strain ATCC 27899 / PCC 7122) TaxID=272123 RepID=K9ZAY3_ANACC|nr:MULTISPECIES: hypothetical protein [Anabaena]AFZ55737.1 hypothetical protein Anacy_0128 [Anabaena cylindrica PCC 7122]MBD2420262.1 hypothetical protein [Anabaena cylindrica FACHB-243]MBY5282126.1 hypothetical protein [Anabaena sp. CCAP 1446/1C]MBY5309576.1 hypothetical protein [Anabaena sp. CCAP 1446/1C]MCM2406084.1 hypothetical protein [Anabaena sp. CCAP 1446/1C]
MEQTNKKIEFANLPLAVYREIAAHLRQVEGVEADLISQTSSEFDYNQSQIAGLSISWKPNTKDERVKQILAYYQNLYGTSSLS